MKAKHIVLAGSLFVLVLLVLIKAFGVNHFRNNASKLAKVSYAQNNIISRDRLNTMNDILLIDLSSKKNVLNQSAVLKISAQDILSRTNLKRISNHQGNIVLVSDDQAQAARIWMLLSQMGIRNLYILKI